MRYPRKYPHLGVDGNRQVEIVLDKKKPAEPLAVRVFVLIGIALD